MSSIDPVVASAVKRYEQMLTQRATTEVGWQRMAELMRPIRAEVRIRRSPGQQKTQHIFDGTALKAVNDLAAALSGSMSSVDYQWFTLQMGYEPLNQVWEVRTWLDEVSRRIFLAFQQSNFGAEMHELYHDLIVFGTGCMWMDERPVTSSAFNGFVFKTVAPGRYVLGEDHEGRPSVVGSELSMSAESVLSHFGDASDATKKKAQEHPDHMVTVLRMIEPLKASDVTPRRKYSLTFIEKDAKVLLRRSFMKNLRCLAPRWEKASEEVYGTGRGHIAYPDIATLNRAVELRLRQWAKAIDPPVLTVDDGVIGKLRLMSGTRTIVRSVDSVRPFEAGAKFDVANFQEEQIRQQIRNYFFSDQLQIPNKSFMTAFEVSSHIEQMQRMLAPSTARLKSELFSPLIDYAFDALMETGVLPPPPPQVIEAVQAGFSDIAVVYTSPLTRTQRSNEVGALAQVLQHTQGLLAANPTALDNFDNDLILREASVNTGVPSHWLVNPELRDQRREQQQKDAAAQQQAAMEQQQAATAVDATKSAETMSKVAQPPQTV
jgi:hypothetical protein